LVSAFLCVYLGDEQNRCIVVLNGRRNFRPTGGFVVKGQVCSIREAQRRLRDDGHRREGFGSMCGIDGGIGGIGSGGLRVWQQ
jgi:hypothetical protein